MNIPPGPDGDRLERGCDYQPRDRAPHANQIDPKEKATRGRRIATSLA